MEEVPSNAQNTSRSFRRAVTCNLPSSGKYRTDVEYTDSDSLGVDENNVGPSQPVGQWARFEDDEEDCDIPSNEDEENMGDEEGHGDEDAAKWKSNLAQRTPVASFKSSSTRKNWIRLIYSTVITPDQILHGKKGKRIFRGRRRFLRHEEE